MTTPALAPARSRTSTLLPALLAVLVAALALFAVAFDQGQALRAVASGVNGALTHELFHDARHMLGFPCH